MPNVEGDRERLKEALARHDALAPDARASYLADLRRSDPRLARELDSLLAHPTRSELKGGAAALMADVLAAAVAPEQAPAVGRTLGPYRLLERLGAGGMGVVYRAEQMEPIRREVALKVLRGGFNPEQLLARFAAERRALALADHPGIARILDAGADEHGTPYLAMELVRGEPITEYCARRSLPLRARLPLLVSVCRAVQHAHQKGIIHRDLKPSNILVAELDGAPVPKVIDFGIARLVDESDRPHETLTGEGQLLGTLEYMSPEQAQGRRREIDTRSDVYSLGAVLYELMAGERPHDLSGKSLPEAIEVVTNERPRALRRTRSERSRVDADLETIVLKALEHEPSRRYDGAGALADDLERYLRAEPISARPPSALYHFRKLAQRHRTAVLAGSSLILLLSVFGVTMTLLYASQTRERERAERETKRAETINRFLQEMLASARPDEMGKDVTVQRVLDAALPRVDRELAGEPLVRAQVLRTLANSLESLGRRAAAESLFRVSIALQRADPRAPTPELAATLGERARCLVAMNMVPESIAPAREALSLCREIHGPESDETARAMRQFGVSNSFTNLAVSESLFTAAAAIARRLHGVGSLEYADAVDALAYGFSSRGNFMEMGESLRVVARIYAREYGEEHTRTLATLQNLCSALAVPPRHRKEALGILRRLLRSSEKVYGPDHTETSLVVRDLGALLRAFGEFEEAERLLHRALAIDERHGFRLQLIETCRHLAILYYTTGRLEEAKRWYRRVIELRRWTYQLAQLGIVLADEGKPSEGLTYTRASLLHQMSTGGPGRDGPHLGHKMFQHGFVLLADGQLDSAAYWLSRATEQMGEQSRPYMEYWCLESSYGVCLARLGRRAEAEPLLARSVPLLLEHRYMEPIRRTVLRLLADHYRGAGRPDMVSRIERELAAMPALPENPSERSGGRAGRSDPAG